MNPEDVEKKAADYFKMRKNPRRFLEIQLKESKKSVEILEGTIDMLTELRDSAMHRRDLMVKKAEALLKLLEDAK